jgi:hypothetical protein
LSTITIIPIHGSDTNWGGFDVATVGAHAGNVDWGATTATFNGTGVVTNQGSTVIPNFIAHTNYLRADFTDVHFATPQDGVAMYLRDATASSGNGLTFRTDHGPVNISLHDVDHALGLGDPNVAMGGYENIGFKIEGLAPFSDMIVSAGAHEYGVFADTSRDFNAASGAPEMGTWAMLLTGFAMMGVAVLRRARTARALK